MNQPDDTIEQVERYLKGLMSTEEQSQLEQKMDEDEEFRHEVELHRDLLKGIEYHYKQKLKSDLKQRETSESDQKAQRSVRLMYVSWVAIAASLLVLIGGAWFFYWQASLPPEQLYSQYQKPYPNVAQPVERQTQDAMEGDQKAFYLYEKGDYEEASQLFNQLLTNQSNNIAYLFYKAQSDMHRGAHDTAIKGFQQVIDQNNNDNRYGHPARWYLALCYLQTNDIEQSRSLLKDISKSDGEFANKAQELLAKL